MITQHNGLPVYKALVDDTEDTGMVVCSLVDEPAIERDFVAFDKQVPLKFKVEDEEKRMVLGPVMIPDMLIYRRDENNTEYYITYPADTIHKMAEKYFKNNYQNNVDTDHSFELLDGVVMTQAFFKNVEMGINPAGFEDLPDDTLFFQFHILSDEVWEEIKAGTWKGYSLAGTFNVVPVEMNKQKKSNKMSKLNKVREMLQSILATFERVSTDKGLLSFDGDELEVGMTVMVVDEEGNESKPEDGEYRTDEGMVYVIADGKVAEIREEPVEDTTGDDVQPEDAQPEEMDNQEPEDEHEDAPASDPEPQELDEKDEQIANLEAEVARLEEELGAAKAENEQLKERIKELEEKPAAEPAAEEFEHVNKVTKTGNKGLDNLNRILNA